MINNLLLPKFFVDVLVNERKHFPNHWLENWYVLGKSITRYSPARFYKVKYSDKLFLQGKVGGIGNGVRRIIERMIASIAVVFGWVRRNWSRTPVRTLERITPTHLVENFVRVPFYVFYAERRMYISLIFI